jgi:hypothetical protein
VAVEAGTIADRLRMEPLISRAAQLAGSRADQRPVVQESADAVMAHGVEHG